MKCRGDLDRLAVSEVRDGIERKVKEENLQDRGPLPYGQVSTY